MFRCKGPLKNNMSYWESSFDIKQIVHSFFVEYFSSTLNRSYSWNTKHTILCLV